ncbi:uncharacterized protein [Gossypium hirsutum]|uniref:ATP-dependent zinc metalloprotease FtsH n=1 Tax=Gossypium hirsutum TaxID=3635 RepID=A0A1U8HV27_GOSHI|nr:uncharacterized protein LOC107889825 [Gossypium hirsutum]
MSARGIRGRATRGRGRGCRGARAESLSSGSMLNLDTSETLVSPITKTGSQDRMAGDDALSQAMLRILEMVARPNAGSGGRGSVMEQLRSNRAELFRGVTGVTPNVAEYWMEATKRIMDDLDFTPEQKLKGVVSLLRDEACQWWLTVKEGTQPKRLTWDFYKAAFQDRSIAKYEAEFLRLSRYARGMVATEYEHCTRFEDGLRDNLRVLIAPQREHDFFALAEKAKIAEERTTRACLKCRSIEHHIRECPLRADQMQAPSSGTAQPPRVVQQPPNGRSQTRGGNGMGRGQGASGSGVGYTEASSPLLFMLLVDERKKIL